MTPADPCFFVLGYGRSGTTLFRRMLSAHSRLFVPPENDVFQRLPPLMRRGVPDMEALDRVLAACPPYYRKIYDFEAFRMRAAASLPMSPAAFFAVLIGSARIAEGKTDPVWGHKMPSEWPYIGTWRQWFPNARYIHVVRQPHDAVASMVEHQLQRYPTTPLVGIWQWRRAYRAIRAHGTELGPDRYMMLRYEDLVTGPEAVLTRVCRFLGVSEAEVPAMIDYKADASAAHTDSGAHMTRTNADLTAARIGRGRGDYSEPQTALLDYVCGRELRDGGYQTRAAAPLGPAARARADLSCAVLDAAWSVLRASRRMRGQL